MKHTLIAVLIVLLMFSIPLFAQKRGGTIDGPVLTIAFIENFNPYTQNVNRSPAPGFIYEPLVVYNFRQNRIEYRLAEHFEYSDDLLSITYYLREGLRWSDGTPLTADDVIFTFEMAKKFPAVDVAGLFVGETPKIKWVEKVDHRTVRFHLTQVNTTVEWSIPSQYIVPKHIWQNVENPELFTNKHPVGSGPFTEVKRFSPYQITVCRNPYYWEEGKPYIDCVRLRQYQSNAQVQAALIRGEIDWGSNFIPDIEKTFVAKDPEHNRYWYPAGSPIFLNLNLDKPPLDDLNFRQAFSLALDRESVVELATYGYASLNPHITGIGDFFAAWYDDDVNQKYDWLNEYNPEKAKQILDDAGYIDSDGDGIRENKDGSPIEFSIMVVSGWTDWIQSVQMITEDLKYVGVNAKTKTVEWGQYVSNWNNREFEVGMLYGMTGVTPYRFYAPLLHSQNIDKAGVFEAKHGWSAAAVDSLLDRYVTVRDEAEQRRIISQLQEVVAQNLMIIPVFSNPTWYQYTTKRFVGWPTEDNPYINPNFYDAGERVILINHLHLR
ncbi:MAG: ABC transporter substrate-binding protein [Gemmatimonadetes bacterium]|nr:MAG: ABC transporter substrate-binding protein [Gemmatimonadota bacterium]